MRTYETSDCRVNGAEGTPEYDESGNLTYCPVDVNYELTDTEDGWSTRVRRVINGLDYVEGGPYQAIGAQVQHEMAEGIRAAFGAPKPTAESEE